MVRRRARPYGMTTTTTTATLRSFADNNDDDECDGIPKGRAECDLRRRRGVGGEGEEESRGETGRGEKGY